MPDTLIKHQKNSVSGRFKDRMGRYRTRIDMDRLPQMLKAGYGQGIGLGYRPWIEVMHLPSRGLVCRVRGLTTGRVHHLLSQMETMYWYALDWAPSVVDIREQFPLLPIEDTLRIAERLGYRHPRHPQTRRPIVMTTDFLVTIGDHSRTGAILLRSSMVLK